MREIAVKTMRGMADGGTCDRYTGGFFRYSTTLDQTAYVTAANDLAEATGAQACWNKAQATAMSLLSSLEDKELSGFYDLSRCRSGRATP